ncbi:MAG: hypothetical protein ABIF85_02130 [Nanoarchaeota archaeon]|nr:hypothetical protein [Nanoarchaeota archaeon]MBU4300860.1 hypothetical protein [Nanoarchaeota archaeon]MBU4451561.1 hypothetical protein [Nanoarchaeota archaeon]MCG2724492.1 hypothetical protein [archaeon]
MVKDEILNWFLRNVYLPRIEVIDKSGFIFVNGNKKYLRDIAFPEYIFIELEKKLDGQMLYTAGKIFGYNYARNTDTLVIGAVDKNKFLNGFYFMVRYIESISYGRKLNHTIDYGDKIFQMTAKDFIICSKNGIGHTIIEGTFAGFCAYAFSDKSIEGIQLKCQGRKDTLCEVICAPSAILAKKGIKQYISKEIYDLLIDYEYLEVNKEHKTQFSSYSLKKFIDFGVFKYDHGTIDYKNERFFLCESSLMYIMEKMIVRSKDADKILFNVSFDWGAQIAGKEKDSEGKSISLNMHPEQFISEFMSSLGWGDISVFKKSGKYSVFSNFFPWTKLSKDIKYTMFRGILSGMLTRFFGKKVILSRVKTDISQGYFSVVVSE